MGLRSLDDIEALIAFFEARGGMLHGFRWKDWADYKSSPPSQPVGPLDQVLGRGDGVSRSFQLRKTYASGEFSAERLITKPVATTLRVAIGGVEQPQALAWTLAGEGVLTFTTPPPKGPR